MTEEDFWNHGPLRNHFRIGEFFHSFRMEEVFGPQLYTDLNDHMFETYGDELDFVEDHDPSNIWTLIEEDGVLSLSSDKLTANRIGYFVTEMPCQENINIVLD